MKKSTPTTRFLYITIGMFKHPEADYQRHPDGRYRLNAEGNRIPIAMITGERDFSRELRQGVPTCDNPALNRPLTPRERDFVVSERKAFGDYQIDNLNAMPKALLETAIGETIARKLDGTLTKYRYNGE